MSAKRKTKRITAQLRGVRSISAGIREIMDADLPLEALLDPKLQRAIVRERAEAVVRSRSKQRSSIGWERRKLTIKSSKQRNK